MHSRDTLVALLWPEYEEQRGRKALRNALHNLRLTLGDDAIVSVGDQLVGLDFTRVTCDAHDLERDAWHSDEHGTAGDVEPLHGFHVRGAVGFEHWMSRECARLKTLLERFATAIPKQSQASIPSFHVRRDSPDAWVMYARGHYLFLRTAHGGPAEDLLRCREYFERALAIDPSFAPAIAGLSNFYAVAARRGVLKPFHEHFTHAIALSAETLERDDSIAIPHVHFGVQALYLNDDFERAHHEFRTAVAKDPTYAEGSRFLGVVLGLANRHAEAVQVMEQAVALEPDIAHFLSSLASARYAAGDIQGAEEMFRRVLLLEPRHGPARARLLHMLESSGRLEEAVSERERHPALEGASAFRAALSKSESAYHDLVQQETSNEVELLIERVMNPDPTRVDDIFAPPVIRLVQLFARMNDWKRVRSWRLQAQAERPALARWFDAIPEIRSSLQGRL